METHQVAFTQPLTKNNKLVERRRSLSPKTVIIIEPESLVRCALKFLVNSFDEYEVLGTGGDFDEAIKLLTEHKPDFLMTAQCLPGKTGIELVSEARRSFPELISVVVTSVGRTECANNAFAAGASAYLVKSASEEELLTALDQAADGKRYISPNFGPNLGNGTLHSNHELSINPLCSLSPREREIFMFLASGLQNAAIAKKLFISPRTVETHRARIVRKLGLQSNADLIRYAIKHGVIGV